MNEKLALANALVGFFLPHAIALVNQRQWSPRSKSIVAFAFCLAAAALTTYVAGTLTPSDWLLSVLIVFAAAQASYKGLWRPTGVVQAVEEKTTVTKA